MSWTLPAALLVDHPALPVPVPTLSGVAPAPRDAELTPPLKAEQRLRLAVQLASVTALLGEFDLWPGRAALRGAGWVVAGDNIRAVLPSFPRSLSWVHARLGGGERAAELTREAALAAIAAACGLPLAATRSGTVEPGFYLEAALERLLAALPRPLDPETGGSLWAVRWDLPPLPEPGEVLYWSVADERIAARLAGATRLALCRRGRPARHLLAPVAGLQLEDADAGSVLVVAGTLAEPDLAVIEGWAGAEGRCAVAFGVFPAGWQPPSPGFEATRLSEHLAVTGVSLERARIEVERRRGRFDPLSTVDRAALTAAACVLFEGDGVAAVERGRRGAPAALLGRWLALAPEGLPEPFLVAQTGLEPAALRRAATELRASSRGGRWRLPTCPPLVCDPLHRELLAAFPPSDPCRLRHLALGRGDPGDLLGWAGERLTALAHEEVRAVLADIAPGELGPGVQRALAEACLAELDLAGGRRALEGAPDDLAALGRHWVEALDAEPDQEPAVPTTDEVDRWPRAAAGIALQALRTALRLRVGDAVAARAALVAALDRLDGLARSWYELELAAVEQPQVLCDRSFRRRVTAGHPKLVRLLLHRRALQLDRKGEARAALRMLERVARSETAPGRLGMVHLDIGSVELEEGAISAAEAHNLRAYRLLQAAGFRQKTRSVLFNLALSDLDRLQLERAERRLGQATGQTEDLFALAGRARLALARGEETAFLELVGRLRSVPAPAAAGAEEGIAFQEGVAELLRSRLGPARELLGRGGKEGRSWLALLDALEGREGPPAEDDGWGVARAAELLRVASRNGAALAERLPAPQRLTVAEGLGLALIERLAGRQPWLLQELRQAAVQLLAEQGMAGWSRALRQQRPAGEGVVAALARVVEGGGPQGLGPERSAELLAGLGLTGLELRGRPDGRVLWRCGEGTPGTPSERGPVVVVPLGGEPVGDAAWRLTAGLLELLSPALPASEDPGAAETGIQGSSSAALKLRTELQQLAPASVPVTLLGETGVGKDVAARALHRLSGRPGQLVAVNVAALPGTLLEAELFGSVKGAFTGADRTRRGLVQSADHGTLFLDEIGDLDLPLQVKLLRFLESQEVRPVGADAAQRVDVRIVAATHRDLQARVRDGSFRQDLYFRIAGVMVRIPPLRERRDDVPVLRRYFERETAARDLLQPVRWSREAEEAMLRHQWPGNVRELRHVVVAAMVWRGGGVVRAEDLPFAGTGPPLPGGTWEEATAEFRRRLLSQALRRNGGNRSAAARELGLSRQTLLYHLRNLGLSDLR